MQKKSIIVTGANGNLGQAVVKQFLLQDWRVFGLVHCSNAPLNHENYTELEVDLTQ